MRTTTTQDYLPKAAGWKRVWMTITVWMVMALSVGAQSNAYNIRDDLYAIFQKAYAARWNHKGVALADSMYQQAERAGDKKAQCMALTVKFLNAYHHMDKAPQQYAAAMKALQDKALQTGYVQYYYWGTNYQTNYLISNRPMQEVLDYIRQNQQFARKNNHTYGIYSSFQNLGMAYLQHGATLQAINNFKEALAFGKRYLPDQDMAINYRRLAECYRVMADYDKMYKQVETGMKTAKTQQARTNLLPSKCYALFMLGRYTEFQDNYSGALKTYGITANDTARIYKNMGALELKIFKLMIEEQYAQARLLLDKVLPLAEQYRLKVKFYDYTEDYKQAAEWQKKLIKISYDQFEKMDVDDMTEINARIYNLRLDNERRRTHIRNAKLELTNTQLTLRNSALELQRTQASSNLARLNADNYQLSLNKKRLEARQLRDSLTTQQARQKSMEQSLRMRNMLLNGILVVAAVILVITSLYIYYIRRYAHRLDHSNLQLRNTISELFVAKDKALQADRMKTMFIQNMSHEIRTPLNAIAGFSQVLVEMGDTLSEEEKKEMNENISNNSELLTTIVNDILDLTSLESGKYVMQSKPIHVTPLCRQVLETVAHRKAPGVELKLHLQIPEDYVVTTDDLRVKQVLINMMTNAEKNTTQGSITLACSLQENPGMLTFSVTDTGIGIPKEQMAHVFERFTKLDRHKQGSGLGLNICRMIAEKLEGKIYIDENYTGGARFLFAIPTDSQPEVSKPFLS